MNAVESDHALQLLVDLENSGRCTPTGLDLEGTDITFDRLTALLGMLGDMKRRTSWMIGDALNYGEKHYGETYAQAATATGLQPGTLQNYCWVCSKVPPARRVQGLSFSAHEVVAGLGPAEQRQWLERAATEDWTRETLRHELRQAGVQGVPAPRPTIRTLAERVAEMAEPRDGGWWVPAEVFEPLREAL